MANSEFDLAALVAEMTEGKDTSLDQSVKVSSGKSATAKAESGK